MRRIAIVGMILMSLVAMPLVAVAAPSPKSEVCHIQDDGAMKTLTVGGKAAQAHLNHGDTAGACEEAPPVDEPTDEPLVATFSSFVSCDTDPFAFGACDVVVTASVNAQGSLSYMWWVDGVVYTGYGAQLAFPTFDGMTHLIALQVADGDRISDIYEETITISIP